MFLQILCNIRTFSPSWYCAVFEVSGPLFYRLLSSNSSFAVLLFFSSDEGYCFTRKLMSKAIIPTCFTLEHANFTTKLVLNTPATLPDLLIHNAKELAWMTAKSSETTAQGTAENERTNFRMGNIFKNLSTLATKRPH